MHRHLHLKNDIGFKILRFILTKSQYLDINIKAKYVYNNSKVGVNEGRHYLELINDTPQVANKKQTTRTHVALIP